MSEEVEEPRELPPEELRVAEQPEELPQELPDGPEKLPFELLDASPPPPLEEEAAQPVESPVEKPQKPKKKPTKPKEQCPRCLRWYAPAVLKYRSHKCVPPTLNGENLVERKPPPEDAPKEEPQEEELPVSEEPEKAALPRDAEILEPIKEEPPPPPQKPTKQLTLVAPPDLPSHEQVAKWVSFERQSKRERKRERWEQQTFGP